MSWNQVCTLIKDGKVRGELIRTINGCWLEVRLKNLALAIWPGASDDELKGKGRLLAKTLREHGAVICKKNGVRWACIPISESLVSLKMGKEVEKNG